MRAMILEFRTHCGVRLEHVKRHPQVPKKRNQIGKVYTVDISSRGVLAHRGARCNMQQMAKVSLAVLCEDRLADARPLYFAIAGILR